MISTINRILFIFLLSAFSFTSLLAQKKEASVEVKGSVKGIDNSLLAGVLVSYEMGQKSTLTQADGSFSFSTQQGDIIVIEVEGYATHTVRASTVMDIVLSPVGTLSEVVDLPYGQTTTVGSATAPVTIITGEELARYPTSNLKEALTGKIPNAKFLRTGYAPGGNNTSMSIRGLNYTIVVDGVVRSLDNLSADEVETVTVLRGMSARAMFGYTAADGLLVVKTKRGQKGKTKVSANAEYGVRAVAQDRMPNWLNAYDYANLFNKASINDGADPLDVANLPYTPEALEGYKTGNNPLRYFDEDLYSQIFNPQMEYKRLNMSYSGGSETTNYFLNFNYLGEGNGYLKNKDFTYDRLRLRSNIDVAVTEDLTFSVDAVASLAFTEKPLDMDNVWGVLGKYPVNAYPVEIEPNMYGTHPTYSRNPVADIAKRNSKEQMDRRGQVNARLTYDFRKYVKGLSMDAYMSYDAYSYQDVETEGNYTYTKYAPVWGVDQNGLDSLYYNEFGTDSPDAGLKRASDSFLTRVGAFANINYERNFGKHHLDAHLNGFIQSVIQKDVALQSRQLNYSFSGAYNYNQKYFADVIVSLTGNQNLPEKNQFKAFPTIGLGWMVSKENFLKDVEAVNALKLRASYGKQGFYNGSSPFLYRTEWKTIGNAYFDKEIGGTKQETMKRVYVDHDGNPDLNWGTTTELDLGIDGVFLNKKLSVQLDYYFMNKKGLVQSAMVPSIVGLTNYYDNVGENNYYGVDGYISYSDKIGGISYQVGINGGFNDSEVVANNQPDQDYEWLNRTGRPVDAIFGFSAAGLFKNQADIESSPEQTYGAVLPGNIKYNDLNNDGVVTSNYDQEMIGHTNPRFTYGIDVTLKYKGFQLYVLGYGMSKRDVNVQANKYYHIYGNDKYSEYIKDNAWTTDNPNENALHPRLTTGSVRNDNLNSTYWLRNVAFFKIKNVELSYMLSKEITEKLKLSSTRFFVRGTNLLTFSEIKDLDPENLNLGVSTYPMTRTFTGGVTVNF